MNLLNLLFKVDTSQLDAAEKKLDKVASAADKTSTAAGNTTDKFAKFKELGGPIGEVAGKVEDLTTSLGTTTGRMGLLGAGIAVVGAAAAAAVIGLIKLALSVADVADAMNDLSNRSNVSTERLSLLDAMAKMAGSSVEELVGSAERLGSKLAKQSEESGLAQAALKELGIATRDANGEQKSMLQLQEEIVIAADRTTNSAKAEGAAVALLGTEYYKIRTAVKEAKEQKVEMYDYMKKTGSIVTTKLAKDSDELNDKISKMGLAFKGMGMSIASIVIPILNSVVEKLGNIAAGAADIIRRYTGGETGSEAAGGRVEDLQIRLDRAKKKRSGFDKSAKGPIVEANAALIASLESEIELANADLRQAKRFETKAKEAAIAGVPGEGNKPASVKPVKDDAAKQIGLTYAQIYQKQQEAQDEFQKGQNEIYAYNAKIAADEQKRLDTLKMQAQTYTDMINPLNVLQRKIEEINANPFLTDAQKADAMDIFTQKYMDGIDKMKEKTKELSPVAQKTFQFVEDAIVGAVTGGDFSFKSLAKSFITQLFRMYVQAQIIGPMIKALTGMAGTGGVAGFIGGLFTPSADGNMFPSGVGNKPTAVRRSDGGTNTFFEKGPEAVLPLVRGSNGQLGVQSSGSGQSSSGVSVGSITIVVQGGETNADTAGALRKELLDTMKQIADGRIAESTRPGGLLRG